MTAILYGAKAGPSTASDLYTINPASPGSPASVGPTGFALTGLAMHPLTGVLYGVTSNNSAVHPNSLISLDTTTGAGTFIGALGTRLPDIAFTAAGTLLGVSSLNGSLYSVNLSTGAATLIGNTGLASVSGGGFAIDSSGTLWLAPNGADSGAHIWTVDPSTGVGTDTGVAFSGSPSTPVFSYIPAWAFDSGDVLYAITSRSGATPLNEHLVTVNVATGVITDKGSLPDTFDAIAWSVVTAGPATKLAFGTQPADAGGSDGSLTTFTVKIEDAGGNVTTSTAAVTVAIASGPGGATLSGTTTVNAVAGTATFSGLAVDKSGTYTLLATSSGLTSETSASFSVSAAPPANDLCADAMVLTGVSGSVSGDNTGAGVETGDPLAAWLGITVAGSVYYVFTAPTDGYFQVTLTLPGGSPYANGVAGIAEGTCGSLAVVSDDVLGAESWRESGP